MAKLNKDGNVKFLVRFEKHSGWDGITYGHAHLETVRLDPHPFNADRPYTTNLAPEDETLKGIDLSCQYDDQGDEWHKPGTPYAVRLTYAEVVTLERAQNAVKVYGAIDRHIVKLRQRFGYSFTSDYRGYVIAVCEALNITEIGVSSKQYHMGIRWCSPAEAMDCIEHQIKDSLKTTAA